MNIVSSNTFKHTLPTLLLLAGMGFASTASANLEVRPGGMVYDTDLNITWLADANYAKTSGYDTDGLMSWNTATTWAANLVYGGFDDWRLPTALNTDGSGPCDGYNCNGGELGHLYYQEFSAASRLDNPDFYGIQTGTASELEKFINIQPHYISGTEWVSNTSLAWYFSTDSGYQDRDSKETVFFAGWAVRTGDVAAVPLPAAVWLFGSALSAVGLLGLRRLRESD